MRTSGVLLHITSLPSPYGVGALGREAREFVDFLHQAGQRVWQVLPIGPTSYGDSPYQSYSTFAGNPYLIDLTALAEEGLLNQGWLSSQDWGQDPALVDYGRLWEIRLEALRRAYEANLHRDLSALEFFIARHASWLEDYALFMAIKKEQGHAALSDWPAPLRRREGYALAEAKDRLAAEMRFWQWIQWRFWTQWAALREYANNRDVRLMGDLPFYVSGDSADVWANPAIFQLDGEGRPTAVAGCPPDYFNDAGQLWGNPLYNWDKLRESGYGWWISRVKAAFAAHDLIRIDHFRGFEAYYAVPAGSSDARLGQWVKGPGMDFFRALEEELLDAPIIAEDLGVITDETRRLLKEAGYPGMKVLQFAFDPHGDSDYLPHNHTANSVAYIGTHDNNTLAGWMDEVDRETLDFSRAYLRIQPLQDDIAAWISALLMSPACLSVLTMQDLLSLPAQARMNTPSTGFGNWRWRLLPGQASPELAKSLRGLTRLYRRI